MSDLNVSGNIDLLRLKNSGILTINGKTGSKKCVVIPIEDNDIFISTNNGNKAYLNLTVCQRQKVSEYGATHYCKQSFSKEFKERLSKDELEERTKVYLGDFKTFSFEAQNQVSTVSASPAMIAEDPENDCPF